VFQTRTPPWLLLIHALPARPTRIRVRTWRRLQDLGAVSLRQAVWVLPHTDQTREDFEWMRAEIRQMGGEATVMLADDIDTHTADQIKTAFRQAREPDYAAIEREARRLTTRSPAARATARPRLQARLDRLDAIAFFPPAGRARAVEAVGRLQAGPESLDSAGPGVLARSAFQGRTWVTRPRPGIDRMASAWLIRRFIDERATFAFAERPPAGTRQIPFDMFGVEFGHTALGCTFETLAGRFGLQSPALERIAHIVHDVDLKDAKFRPVEAPAFEPLVDGLRHAFEDDKTLLDHGMRLFEALFRAFDAAARTGAGRASRARQTGAGATATATAKARTPTTRKRARR
jgi:hypothetical protein